MMRNNGHKRLVMLILLLLAVALHGQVIVSHYAEGKVFTSNGFTLEGKNLRMSMESVTLEVAGQDQVLSIDQVVQVMAKKGKSTLFGRNCAMIAFGVNALSYLLTGGEYEDEDGVVQTRSGSDAMVGAVMLSGLSYGVGYGIGMATDHWEVVYLKR